MTAAELREKLDAILFEQQKLKTFAAESLLAQMAQDFRDIKDLLERIEIKAQRLEQLLQKENT